MNRKYQLHAPSPVKEKVGFYKELNDQQLAVVTAPAGAHLVIAGAGTGKTSTLTYRVGWLLEQGYQSGEILLVTFTNKAARTMIERVNVLFPGATQELWSGTFHSIGHRILKQHPDEIGFSPGFTIMDREDQGALIESVVVCLGLRANNKTFPKETILSEIFSFACNTGEKLNTILAKRYQYFADLEEQILQVSIAYEQRKHEVNALDFDDLLLKTYKLFRTNPSIAESYQRRFRAILVDEYQDTNRLQANLIDNFASIHKHLMVVGDDAQSIYSWRGADCFNILEFPKRYPDAMIHRIETNYRSVPQILEVANASILNNSQQFFKNLRTTRSPSLNKPALVPLSTNNAHASFIAQRVLELHNTGINFCEIAVLYRAHYHSMEIQMEFSRRGIPFTITSGLRFFEQAHIKDVAAFLKFAMNPSDEIAFKRIVSLLPSVASKTAEKLWVQSFNLLKKTRSFSLLHEGCHPPSKAMHVWKQLIATLSQLVPMDQPLPPSKMIELVNSLFYNEYMQEKFVNYEARRDDLHTLACYAKQFEQTDEFLAQLSLLGEADVREVPHRHAEKDQVFFSTIHQAKGLEWQVVFLTWLTQGMFPSLRSMNNESSLEEERRLFYVGITRCKEELYLTYPEIRLNAPYGEAFQHPSLFLEELPEHLIERWDVSHTVSRRNL